MYFKPTDWRYKDELWQSRHFLLSSLVRSKVVVTSKAYEFCDYAISQGYGKTASSMDLKEIDPWLLRMYKEWEGHTNS